jgi:ER membrane protein complex subunit 3
MQDQMSGAAMTMPQDPKAAFKSEWEALEITEYQNALQNVEVDLLANIVAETANSIHH